MKVVSEKVGECGTYGVSWEGVDALDNSKDQGRGPGNQGIDTVWRDSVIREHMGVARCPRCAYSR